MTTLALDPSHAASAPRVSPWLGDAGAPAVTQSWAGVGGWPRRRAGIVVVALLHLVALWALLHPGAPRSDAGQPAPTYVHVVADIPDRGRVEPMPELRRPERSAPPAPWAPVPDVVVAVAPAPASPAPPAAPAAAATPARPSSAPETAASAGPVAVAPVPERQIAIGQVAYLSPPVLDYPLAARRLREEGVVQVRVRVDAQGRPDQMAVLRSSGSPRLDQAALATVRATRFRPYTEDGVARPFWVVMPLVFELDT